MTHTMIANFPVGNDHIDVEITYNFIPGMPEQGPSWASGGEPAEPAEVEFISAALCVGMATVPIKKVLDDWASAALTDELYEKAVTYAQEQE